MEDRLKQPEEQMQASQDEAVQRAAKKAKRDKSFSFKKKGHQEQSDFNEHVCECVEKAQDKIVKRPLEQSALDNAKRAVDEGPRLISERQKLIKIADRSEYGWGVVAEYQADGLASGSDDERKLEKAELAAEKKVMKRKKSTRMSNGGTMVRSRQAFGGSQPQLHGPGTQEAKWGSRLQQRHRCLYRGYRPQLALASVAGSWGI